MKVLGTSKVKVCNLNSNLANSVGGLKASFLALVIIGSWSLKLDLKGSNPSSVRFSINFFLNNWQNWIFT